ncbi:SGNH/GDSL hydrolase family protein [Heyndrickxia acidiproducens]|uniref:SGNH/GDSL hydrolase family protein n=1 Tax=Heyndrickxia acidiproducens TaxID=1121084 RepID=UPI00035FA685|nr:SGNH/GDSL hydrolase family protein [Heyndrickxia acidiproducens]
MRKIIIPVLVAVSLVVTGCSTGINDLLFKTASVEKKKEIVPVPLRIVSIGDSLTEGVGDSKGRGGYTYYLKHELDALKGVKKTTVANYGVKGNRTDHLLLRLQDKNVQKSIKEADLVIITIGGNDIMKVFRKNFSNLEKQAFEAEMSNYKNRLNQIFKQIRTIHPGVKIAMIGIYNPFTKWFSDIKEVDDILAEWNQTSKSVTENYKKTTFIPVADIFDHKEEKLLYEDHFHPNDTGYQLMSKRVYRYLLKDNFLGIPK